ncbi:MAG: hypothetical protein R3D85_13345 [Paracoccaceae bacterium]
MRLPPLVFASVGLSLAPLAAARAEQLIADTLIVSGSLCAGAACASGEDFSNGTVKFRQNAVRVHFDDASTTPQTDWQIEINDGSQSGPSYFALNDLTAGTTPFAIDAGAPDSAFLLTASGDIGLGTLFPLDDLHIVEQLTPAIRFDVRDGGGAPLATWRIEASDNDLSLQDLDGGVKRVFFIQHGSEQNALGVKNDAVFIGTAFPAAKLHIDLDPDDATYPRGFYLFDGENSDGVPPHEMAEIKSVHGNAKLLIEEHDPVQAPREMLSLRNNGRPEITLANTATGGEWSFGAGTNFILKQGPIDQPPSYKTKLFEITDSGDAILAGSLTTGGTTCGGGCDAVFAPDYPLPSIAEHAARMRALGHLPNVGPTPEGQPIDLTDKLGRMLNELEHAHLYIAQLERELRTLPRLRTEMTRQQADSRARGPPSWRS